MIGSAGSASSSQSAIDAALFLFVVCAAPSICHN
jgi:hypothetical protein